MAGVLRILEYSIKVKIVRRCHTDAAVCPVINDLARTQAGSRFKKVDAQASTPASNIVGIDPPLAQTIQCGLTHLMRWHLADKTRIVPKIGETDSHICLTASIVYIKRIALNYL